MPIRMRRLTPSQFLFLHGCKLAGTEKMEPQPKTISFSYLKSIQEIPGDTPGKKFKWIADMASKSSTDEGDTVRIPPDLQPFFQTEVAKLKKDPKAIIDALKSDNAFLINKALQAKWFFDGSHAEVANVKYYFKHIFPYISLNTRGRLVKVLAHRLGQKSTPSEDEATATRRSKLAEEFFEAITDTYCLSQAVPLLTACSPEFTYYAIVKRKIVLSQRMLNMIFRKNPDLAIRYLKLCNDGMVTRRDELTIFLRDNVIFLHKLVKKHMDAFIELMQKHKKNPLCFSLSNVCTEIFLKNAKDSIRNDPALFLPILNLKLVGSDLLEEILSKLMPNKEKDYNVGYMLNYLKYYPEEKKADLLINTYREKYYSSFFSNKSNVTFDILQILSYEDRIREAKLMAADYKFEYYQYSYKKSPICFFPIDEAIQTIKKEITICTDVLKRASVFLQLIYACKINKDTDALREILQFYFSKHKNETTEFHYTVINRFIQIYDIPKLSNDIWDILMRIMKFLRVKGNFKDAHGLKLLENAIHHHILQREPIEDLLEMYIDEIVGKTGDFKEYAYRRWNILNEHMEFEKKCLNGFFALAEKKFTDPSNSLWEKNKRVLVSELLKSMYDYNERHIKITPNKKLSPQRKQELQLRQKDMLSIKQYPWFMNLVKELAMDEKESCQYPLKSLIKINENELYLSWFPLENSDPNMDLRQMTLALKRDPTSVIASMDKFFKLYYSKKYFVRFIKSTMWYQTVPIKIADRYLEDFYKKKDNISIYVLASLLSGEEFATLIKPVIPKSATIDHEDNNAAEDYLMIKLILRVMKYTNTPVPLKIIEEFTVGDYLQDSLGAMVNATRRTDISRVIPFTKELSNMRVSVKKHGIRLLSLVAPTKQITEFLLEQWREEQNASIRKIIFERISRLFTECPRPGTWEMLKEATLSLTAEDDKINLITFKLASIPNEYVSYYIMLAFRKIDNLSRNGLSSDRITSIKVQLLSKITSEICNLLPNDICTTILEKYLFDSNIQIADVIHNLIVEHYLLTSQKHLDQRLDIFKKVLEDAIRNGWNKPHPDLKHYYPVNYGVRNLIKDIVARSFDYSYSTQVIKRISVSFQSMLSYLEDFSSNVLLDCAMMVIKVNSDNPDDQLSAMHFGNEFELVLLKLIDNYTLSVMPNIVETVQTFLAMEPFKNKRYSKEESILDFCEGLTQLDNPYGSILIANILPSIDPNYDRIHFNMIMERLKQKRDVSVKIILNELRNSRPS
ncbi:uncharacterized protein [Prorops nasuta]|uniref:uncharacterized protein n=1 Tax=Prorops nasuta TaxID=863751 RepID=UPI0034CE85F5